AVRRPTHIGGCVMSLRSVAGATASSFVLAAALASAALAQDATQPAPATSPNAAPPGSAASRPAASSNSGAYTVDTIVVTAQKRKENLQDVPIVVTVVNKQLLQDSGVRDIKELSNLTPGLTVTSTASEAVTIARI